jgi:A/G-specific adenine glycosylase
MDSFHPILLQWYRDNRRQLPWRDTTDPYLIWLSEVILQQTRVNQGLSYYHRFVTTWPDIRSLAVAHEDEVLKMWQGLGYYSRARNLHQAAREILVRYDGVFPSSFEELKQIKGIGNYTAAAIASIAFGLPEAVIDGNVYRVLSRIFSIDTPINSKHAKHVFGQLASQLLYSYDPGTYNQAIMEFGALQCTPKNPDCPNCPLNNQCMAFARNKVLDFPVKLPKKPVSDRFFNYLIPFVSDNHINKVYIRKRTENDIWKGLYEFPLIESSNNPEFEQIIQSEQWYRMIAENNYVLHNQSRLYKHRLTHRLIHARFFIVKLAKKLDSADEFALSLIGQNDLGKYAFPRLIDRYLEESGGFEMLTS